MRKILVNVKDRQIEFARKKNLNLHRRQEKKLTESEWSWLFALFDYATRPARDLFYLVKK